MRHLREQRHAGDGVHEEQEQQQRPNVRQGRQRQVQRREDGAQAAAGLHKAEQANHSHGTEQREVDADVADGGTQHEGDQVDDHDAEVEPVPAGGPVLPPPEANGLHHDFQDEDDAEHDIRAVQHVAPPRGLRVVPRRHHQHVQHDEPHDGELEVGVHDDVEQLLPPRRRWRHRHHARPPPRDALLHLDPLALRRRQEGAGQRRVLQAVEVVHHHRHEEVEHEEGRHDDEGDEVEHRVLVGVALRRPAHLRHVRGLPHDLVPQLQVGDLEQRQQRREAAVERVLAHAGVAGVDPLPRHRGAGVVHPRAGARQVGGARGAGEAGQADAGRVGAGVEPAAEEVDAQDAEQQEQRHGQHGDVEAVRQRLHHRVHHQAQPGEPLDNPQRPQRPREPDDLNDLHLLLRHDDGEDAEEHDGAIQDVPPVT